MTLFNKKTGNFAVTSALSLFAASATLVTTTAAAATATDSAVPTIYKAQQDKAINFSFALEAEQPLSIQKQAVTTSSNEYYFTVNGSQLNKGIDIYTTAPGALIKISRQGEQGNALKGSNLQLHSVNQPKKNLAQNIIDENALKSTGVFNNATAIKLAADVQPGNFKLNYAQALSAKNKYVVHVKEKNSVNKLMISAQKQHFTHGENFSFTAAMMAQGDTLALNTVSAYVTSPSGKKIAVTVDKLVSGVAQISAKNFTIDADAIESPINGLYELHLNTTAGVKGQQIHRTGKIAFALAPNTADLNKLVATNVSANKPLANIGLTVKTAGRFEVRATLYGHDAQGNLKPIMETHSAQNLTAGEQSIAMLFDKKILKASTFKAPYVVNNVRLYDQTRMSRL
jgi:hypothetical protein